MAAINKDYFKIYPGTPWGRNKNVSVHHSDFRIEVARNQATKPIVSVERIFCLVNEALRVNGCIECPSLNDAKLRLTDQKIDYEAIKEKYGLDNDCDIIWIKFTTDGHVGVVAKSSDINHDYDRTSGIIIQALKKEWDKSFVLLFPLKKCNKDESLSEKEKGLLERYVGNHLIGCGVPILDFYSHNY